jgi:rod shape-determining protein MreC
VRDKQVRRRRAVLALLVVASLILLTAYFGESPSSPLHSVQRGIAEVLSPVQEGASKVLSPVRDIAGWVSSTIHAKSENSRLRKQNQELEQKVAQLQYAALQNQRESALVGLDNTYGLSAYSPLSAAVIEYDPSIWYKQIEVDKGSSDGVQLYDPVVAPGGLVGDVTTVGPSYSIVTELTDDNFAVGAVILDDKGDAGELVPAVGNPNSLLLQYLPPHATDINQSGSVDRVVTSGFVDSTDPVIHSYFPPGIPIGYVSSVNLATLLNQQQVTVAPYVDLRHLSVVQILTRPHASGTASASVAGP